MSRPRRLRRREVLMRRLFAMFAIPFSLAAAPIGNPADPAVLEEGFWISDRCWSSLRFGLSGDFLAQKRLRPDPSCSDLGIGESEIGWKAAVCDIGWNMRERFEIRAFTGPAAAADLAGVERSSV